MAAAPASGRLQSLLQKAVQSVKWTYSLYWEFCQQQGVLVWAEGYYNGAIKTRKTVQPMEVSAEEATLQRSQQLRELYDSLSAGEGKQPAKRPCAALLPEDLTESEWFYLICVSFTFPPGVGLPGKAYARRHHLWLTGANEVDSKSFSRAILAKSAGVKTVLCIPLLHGVVELGTLDKIQEDIALVQQIRSFFAKGNPPQPTPKPALSEHSTSNPATSSTHTRFHSLPNPAMYAPAEPVIPNHDDEEEGSAETGRNSRQNVAPGEEEPIELLQLDLSQDIRLGSPEDASNNNLDPDLVMIGNEQLQRADSFRAAESSGRWQEPVSSSSHRQQPSGSPLLMDELSQEATQYSQTISTILQKQPARWAESSPTGQPSYCSESAFTQWTNHSDNRLHMATNEATSQRLLRNMLFTVPFLHAKYGDDNSPKSRDTDAAAFRKGAAQEDLSANHVLAERRRREKHNERFIVLRSLVPFVTKMDKASILGDTIEYLKQLRKKVQDLEVRNRQMEADQRSRSATDPEQRSEVAEKRKMRIVEYGGGVAKLKAIEAAVVETSLEVSIIENDALLELRCSYREGLLLDIMHLLRELRIETTTVQSSSSNGVFTGELRAKVRGKKPGIMEVKKAINRIIPKITC